MVFATVTAEGYVNSHLRADTKCIFNQNDSACHYAVGIGVIAFMACVGFAMVDAYLPLMSSAQERKYSVMADLAFSGQGSQRGHGSSCLLLWPSEFFFDQGSGVVSLMG